MVEIELEDKNDGLSEGIKILDVNLGIEDVEDVIKLEVGVGKLVELEVEVEELDEGDKVDLKLDVDGIELEVIVLDSIVLDIGPSTITSAQLQNLSDLVSIVHCT